MAAALLALAGCSNGPGGNAAGPVPSATEINCEDPSITMAQYTENCTELEEGEGGTAASPASEAPQPIDGGTYTWASGITVTYKVEDYGTFDQTQDWCGDGSCGISQPADSDIGLRYTVSVPADFPGTLEPSGCAGSLSVVNGNDEEALRLYAGDHYSGITGPMLAGATKEGLTQYVIAEAYAGKQFLLSSSCGDTSYSGERALFTGNLG
ncbi:hypothetical protein MN205_03760 [Kineococcus sp. TRM81007]|uniref:hypothetical protein n=1 Tax=Kineococcus sp. TRM81007 TaxID=2925831 RepID=UPI001F596EAA|nr:hypothetical protein [Kineococcus sp. TRM81007]MCI2237605.1 hypothetical protein [Kineococcus sp. TRM81007]